MRRFARHAVAATIAILGVVAATAPAAAHNVLVASTPEDKATIAQAPAEVELIFDQIVQNQFPQVSVVDEDGAQYAEGEPEIVGETITQQIGALPAGDYTVAYRILSADGHPIEGSISFTVSVGAAPEDSNAAASEPDTGGDPTVGQTDDSSFPWLIAAGGVAIVGAVGGLTVAAARRRRAASREPEPL